MRIAVVAGGWHWPGHFYQQMAHAAAGVDLFVVAHRSPELAIVRDEKRDILGSATGLLADLDRELYRTFPTIAEIESLGWHYQEAPNTVGDWGFFNQWLETHDYQAYDVILNCHDDTYLRTGAENLFELPIVRNPDWLIVANGRYPGSPEAYVRGSFEFWRREMLDLLGGRIDLGTVNLTREGKTDSPADFWALSDWNDTAVPLRKFMHERKLSDRIGYLSPYYRISRWVIEAERGFLHFTTGEPWSLEQGLRAFP